MWLSIPMNREVKTTVKFIAKWTGYLLSNKLPMSKNLFTN